MGEVNTKKESCKKMRKKWVSKMEKLFKPEIQKSFENSRIFLSDEELPKIDTEGVKKNTIITVRKLTTSAAIDDFSYLDHICALNFASFTKPGGGFLKGATAQEECLCWDSTLYNVLRLFEDSYYKNHKNLRAKNEYLYNSDILYTPDIYFYDNEIGKFNTCSIISCSAPNCSARKKKGVYLEYEERIVMRERIRRILYVAQYYGHKTLILGAFGCGVFGNDPYFVAETFFGEIYGKFSGVFDAIIFAIPPSASNDNYEAFKNLFNGRL